MYQCIEDVIEALEKLEATEGSNLGSDIDGKYVRLEDIQAIIEELKDGM